MADAGVRWREVNILDEMDHAVQMGSCPRRRWPSMVNWSFASLPSEKKLRQALQQRLGRPLS